MRHERLGRSGKRLTILLLVSVLGTLLFAQAALAQSGRRQSKNPSPTPPPPTPSATESPTEPGANPPTAKRAHGTTVIVGGDRLGSSLYINSSYVALAVDSCIDRLKESTGLEVIGGGSMNRKQAIDRAKKEQEAYVLLLEMRVDDDAQNNISIGYWVFTPQTAKVLSSGRVYLGTRNTGAGGVGVGLPTVRSRLPIQYQLRDGGHEVADRVKGKFPATPPD